MKSWVLIACIFCLGNYEMICESYVVRPKKTFLLASNDLSFLETMLGDVLNASTIKPGDIISPDFGPNQTGGNLIRPGGKFIYPAFWIRDYAMSLPVGLVSRSDQKHMLLLTAKTQAILPWVTKWGTKVPKGSIADHIRIDDGKPIFFPGTYDFENQGKPIWGNQPPFCDQFYFVQMVFEYVKKFPQDPIFKLNVENITWSERLELAFNMPPSNKFSGLVEVNDSNRGVDFGFRDAVYITGELCFASLLKFQAAGQLAYIFTRWNMPEKANFYSQLAQKIKKSIPKTFLDARGMLHASTGKSSQADVWSTAYAVYLGVLDKNNRKITGRFLRNAYLAGTLSYHGNIRHILTSDDFSATSAWELSEAKINTYQNGAYWGTPVGWVAHAIAQVDVKTARKLAYEYVQDLREGDFRKGGNFGAPWECFNAERAQNPVYLTSVALPFFIFKHPLYEFE